MKVIIAAAGTGGHINPGIAIANKIKKEEPDSKIIFIGTQRGLETDLVPRAGYELKTIDSYGIARKLTLSNIVKLFKTMISVRQAKKIIKEFKPDIIVGTGGYICVSVCMAAKKTKTPYILHESNVMPGIATKLFAKNAKKILVGFEEAKEKISSEANVVVTGTPTKMSKYIYDADIIDQRIMKMGFDDEKPIVLAFGGSQGSKSINESIFEIITNKLTQNKYQIIWATGTEQYEDVKKRLLEKELNIDNIKGAKISPFIYNMEETIDISNLLVCRSGAMTITELEKKGKPAIFIPYPYATENHQEYNARALEKKGAAKVILDKELNGNVLNDMILDLLSDKDKLKNMAAVSKSLSINDVEDKIFVEIKQSLIN